ncbi:MAG: acetyl-CoA carboxylase biotin carboxylase subunit [Planctomycetes bacterium]|nr:acetyl-CoA carboxylase biotin carboxylase subunit [Planctomycetota bacterium]
MTPALNPIRKVLVANRGEIAVRVIRAVHEMGLKAVAVYSDADRGSLHVRYADEAFHLPGEESSKTYLNQALILVAAKSTGCDALHPGYGFLSENAAFARAVASAGLTFIGPSPEVIDAMGDKIRARETMRAAGVPLVPGQSGITRENLSAAAKSVGYPLMLKASAGGGGKGIRIVRQPHELLSAFERAQGEARTAFGDPTVYIERYVENPHHIEIQIFGDQHGNVVHMFDRECSVQRRHQKVVEESPSPFVTAALREAMGRCAVNAAKSIGYSSAGTFEFLVDSERNFYFLEVNTRLQVEHTVTEMCTGIDLVREQIRVASGLELSFTQADLRQQGHAIEVRICAEDAENNFLPCVGRVDALALPGGPGVRLDSALFTGMVISLWYDSLLAKLVVHGRDRAEALTRMRQALSEIKIADLNTNVAFLGRVVRNEEFVSGVYDTGLIARMPKPQAPDDLVLAASIIAVVICAETKRTARPDANGNTASVDPWKLAGRRGNMRGR